MRPGPEELAREAEKARLLLEAARQLGETLEPERVYDRFRELLADAVPHDGVVVSSYDESADLIRCEYAWVEGARLDLSIFPPLRLNRTGGGMQSRVITTGEPLLANDVRERVKGEGVFYDVDREGQIRKLPDEGETEAQAALMVPVKHEGRVVGVVQVMSDRQAYTPEQLELTEGLVAQMAAAVRNARLHDERARLVAAEAAARATAAEREHAERVLEAVGDGVFLVDEGGAVRSWNRAAETLTGRARRDVVGSPAAAVFAGWPQLAAEVPVGGGGDVARQVTLPVDLDGQERWLGFVAVRIREGVVYAFRDLTSERRLEEAKTDFVATVSHELRTPMTAVFGAAKTLQREDIQLTDEQRRALLDMIATQATRLSLVTEDVLLASRLDRGELRLETAEVDIDEVVRETVDAMRQRLDDPLTLEVRPGSVGAAAADRDRLQQVLVNLIDNAAKYSPAGGTIVVATTEANGVVRVSVEDEGVGIAPSEQPRIFEKFYRVGAQLTTAPAGTGLGLYICRELVQQMGGRIGVESQPGRGSTFFFELPRGS